MLFHVGSVLLIDVIIHLYFVVIEKVSMYFATICAFLESVNAILRIFLKLGILIGRFLEPKKFDANDQLKGTILLSRKTRSTVK